MARLCPRTQYFVTILKCDIDLSKRLHYVYFLVAENSNWKSVVRSKSCNIQTRDQNPSYNWVRLSVGDMRSYTNLFDRIEGSHALKQTHNTY